MERLYCVYVFYIGIIVYHNTVNGWQCPHDEVVPDKYVRSGEPAVISFQTTLIYTSNQLLIYSVLNFNRYNLYTVTFYDNQFQNQKTYLGSEFIGDASVGNFTVKTAAVNSTNGGIYLLQYKVGAENYSTVKCFMLHVLGKPQKATIIRDSNNILGRDSRLTCNSLSTTYPTNHTLKFDYNWKVNDVTNPTDNTKYVYSSSRKQLTIKAVSKKDANTRFKCSATETGGSITGLSSDESNQLTFRVIYGPDADTTRLNPPNTQYTLNEGVALADITCSGECYPSCNYKWTKSGSTVNNRAMLSLGQLSKTGAGIYTCEVTNSNTTSISAIKKRVNVNVMYGPDADSLKLNPSQSSFTENEGTSLNDITCSTDCYPKCTYKWTKSGYPLSESNVLSLGTLNKDKAATYTCTAYNPTTKHTISTSVSVHVRFGPTVCTLNVPSQYYLTEGRSSSQMKCQAECYPECTYAWTNMSSNSQVGTNGKLQLINSKRYEAGTYKCLCENKPLVKRQSSSVVITIQYPPDVTVLQSTTNFTEGNNFTLTCDAKGVPSVYQYNSLTQMWNGVLIPNTNSEKIGTSKYSSLYIPSLQLQDSGTYSCFVNNGVNTTDSTSSLKIKIRGFPKVLTRPLALIGTIGGERNVSIQFYSFPEIQDVIFKRYDDQTMKNDTAKKHIISHYETVVKDKFYGKEVSLVGMQANLQFKEMIPGDFGGYTLILKNEIGEISTRFEIKSESIPSIPKSLYYFGRCNGVHTFIFLGGSNGGLLQTFVIETRMNGKSTWIERLRFNETDTKYLQNEHMMYKFDITGLIPNVYDVRVLAGNELGWIVTELAPMIQIKVYDLELREQSDQQVSDHKAAIVGGSLSFVIVGIIVVGVFIVRKKTCTKADKTALQNTEGSAYDSLQTRQEANTTYSTLTLESDSVGVSKNKTYENLETQYRQDTSQML